MAAYNDSKVFYLINPKSRLGLSNGQTGGLNGEQFLSKRLINFITIGKSEIFLLVTHILLLGPGINVGDTICLLDKYDLIEMINKIPRYIKL